MINLFSDEKFPVNNPAEKTRGQMYIDTKISISIVVLCDTRILVEKVDDKWMFPSDYFLPKFETVQQTASRVLYNITEEDTDPKKWIPVDVRSDPGRKDIKYGKFSVDIGYVSILELSDVPLIDPSRFVWALVNFDNGKFPFPLIEDHRQLWEAAFGVFNLLLKP